MVVGGDSSEGGHVQRYWVLGAIIGLWLALFFIQDRTRSLIERMATASVGLLLVVLVWAWLIG